MAIELLTALEGKLSSRVLGLVREWTAMHQGELPEDRILARAQAPLKPIEPLR
jgi:hypothetical protein